MRRAYPASSPTHIQSRLLLLAGLFLFFFSLALTLAPAARARSWTVEKPWFQWVVLVVWIGIFFFLHQLSRRRLPDADPYLLPIAGLLTGWGTLTILRLDPYFGFRQTAWLLISGAVLLLGMHLPADLKFLRKYKYLWLTGGLLITALTLVFGTDPGGGNVHAWLGCCGLYFQPSEPLKLLLIIFLASYLADRLPLSLRAFPLLAPTLVVVGVALLLLVVQRDLGTASIFIFLYASILFVATSKKRALLIFLIGLAAAGAAGYFLFDLIRLRVDAWLNPWLDPSGRSFQIVQSLIAVANGGTFGRGPGLGSPGLVPVAISDFIFTSIAEETGLVGTLGLLSLIGLITARSIRVALRAPDLFQRILASGLAAYIGGQSILIIGGNIRLLPLTGVTLPFVSYGGSSLLTSFLALLLLIQISSQSEAEPAPLRKPQPYLVVAGLIGLGLLALSAVNAWWAIWREGDILARTDNARRSIADRYVKRGSILDRHEVPINLTEGSSGGYVRTYVYPDLASVAGYTDRTYGQSGLEASLDPYLRGLQGNPARSIWWDHIVYGQPPPGLDVRLSLDLDIQRQADALLGDHHGAIVLINAASGEILAMASHPTFDPNHLEILAPELLNDPESPLLNRAAQGMYPPGEILLPFFQAAGFSTWPSPGDAEGIYSLLGFYQAPSIDLPVAIAVSPGSNLLVSPLQMAIATTALCNNGVLASPRLAVAVKSPLEGWVILPSTPSTGQVFLPAQAVSVAQSLIISGKALWQWHALVTHSDKYYSWSVAGTVTQGQAAPLVVVVLLEENNLNAASNIGETLLEGALEP